MPTHEINVSSPWFKYIADGFKKIEGRLNKGTFSNMKVGDMLTINNTDKTQQIIAKIVDISKYNSFESYLIMEGLKRTLPGIKTIEDGVKVYRQFYNEKAEKEYGVVAIRIKIQ